MTQTKESTSAVSKTEAPLKFPWTFTFSHRQPNQKLAAAQAQGNSAESNYLDQMKNIGTVRTVQDFWSVYQFLKRPSQLPAITDYHVFRHGIKPIWEDPANQDGGKWILRIKKGLADRFWEDLILAVIGDDLLSGKALMSPVEKPVPGQPLASSNTEIDSDEICGLVLSIRQQEDIISLWTRSAQLKHTRMQLKIRDAIKRVLGLLDTHVLMEYKAHRDAMQDHSSFRNTDKFS